MKCADLLFDIEVHHHGGALSVRPALHLTVPARFDQPHERINSARHRGRLIGCSAFSGSVAFPVDDKRVAMRLQSCFQYRRLGVGQGDPPEVERVIAGLGDRRLLVGTGARIGARLQFDRGPQLVDGGHRGQLRVVLVGPVTRT